MDEKSYPFYEIVEFPAILLETPGFQETLDRLIDYCQVPRFLAGCGLPLTDETEKRLSLKLVAHLLDQMTTDRVDAPYISVWEKGRHQEVKMIYVNPAIEKITGFTAQQVLKVGFSVFVPDDLIFAGRDHQVVEEALGGVPLGGITFIEGVVADHEQVQRGMDHDPLTAITHC